MSAIKYRPEVDGLRAVAIIPVVLFHLGYEWIEGGYFGVDIFFVISGYLITSILLREQSFQTFSFKNFWMRRIRRIMPALLCMVACVLAVSYFISFRPVLKEYSNDAASAIFSYANIGMLLKFGDYWGAAAESSPFLHCWSLSVEEQFYLVYPMFIAFFITNKTRLLQILSLTTILSFVAFMVAAKFQPTYGFFLLPTRAWELSCGGLLAISGMPFGRLKKIFPLLGVILILLSFFVFTGSKGIGFSSVLPVIGSVLIIGYSTPEEFVGRFLSTKPMVEIGKVSYSLYLWHWPVIVLAKYIPARLYVNEHLYILAQIGIMLILTIISYKFVEQITRNMKPILSFVGIVLFVCLAEIMLLKSSFVESDYASVFSPLHTYTRYYNVSPAKIKNLSKTASTKYKGTIAPSRESAFQEAAFNNGIEVSDKRGGFPELVVIGDSHGSAMAKVLDEVGKEHNLNRSFFTMSGNNPLFPIPLTNQLPKSKDFTEQQFRAYAQNLIEKIKLWKPQLIIVSCRWDTRTNDFGKVENLINLAKETNTKVLLINQPPVIQTMGDNNSAQYFSYLGYKPNNTEQFIPLISTQRVDEANAKLAKLIQKHKNAAIVDINSSFQKEGKALVIKDNLVLYFDDDHLSYEGSLVVKDKISETVQNLLKKQ